MPQVDSTGSPQKDNDHAQKQAQGFFEKARQASQAGDFDIAIDGYLQGLRLAPDEVAGGHIPLRELALRRHSKGGSKPSKQEIDKFLQGGASLERMLNAEYLLSKDPTHLPYAELLLKAAVAGGYKETAKWIADLIFLANNNAKKPSLPAYLLLKDCYIAIGQFDRAIAACRRATGLNPNDSTLASELNKLFARQIADQPIAQQGQDQPDSAGNSEQKKNSQPAQSDARGDGYAFLKDEQADRLEHPTQEDGAQALARARVFFERASKLKDSAAADFDYAIDMYLEGLRLAPDDVLNGHIGLREMALLRQSRSGKKPSMMEKMKRMRGKTPLERMLNAEYLFAKDPNYLPYAEAALKAAVEGAYNKTAKWFADLMFQANSGSKKPSVQIYVLVKDSYLALGHLDRAAVAGKFASELEPQNAELADEYKRLTAELTVSRGKYDQGGDFRDSIKDRHLQEKLQSQERIVKTEDYRLSAVEEARKELAREPNVPAHIFNLADTLADLETDEGENEAIKLLEDAYAVKSDFSFAQRAGQIRIKQLKRKIRRAEAVVDAKPGDVQAASRLSEMLSQLKSTELEHWRLCVANYPTDLRARYEYGLRLFLDKQYDNAIPFFQEAQKDPRNKIAAMDKIGLCFFMKGWSADAIDVFKRAIDSYEIKDDGVARELRYNLARAYEEQGDSEKALEIYRKIAQSDFAYKDVSQRVDKLRKK